MNRAFSLIEERRPVAPRLTLAAAALWTILFALHTLGGAIALEAATDASPAGMLIETAPMLAVLLIAAAVLARHLRLHRPIGALTAVAWLVLPPIADAALWQPVAHEIAMSLTN